MRCGICGPIIDYRLLQLVSPPHPTRVEALQGARLGRSCCDCSGLSLESEVLRSFFLAGIFGCLPVQKFRDSLRPLPTHELWACTLSARDLRLDACPELIHTLAHLLSMSLIFMVCRGWKSKAINHVIPLCVMVSETPSTALRIPHSFKPQIIYPQLGIYRWPKNNCMDHNTCSLTRRKFVQRANNKVARK